jgi:hypothetical protein
MSPGDAWIVSGSGEAFAFAALTLAGWSWLASARSSLARCVPVLAGRGQRLSTGPVCNILAVD